MILRNMYHLWHDQVPSDPRRLLLDPEPGGRSVLVRGSQLAASGECATLDVGVVTSICMLDVEIA